MNFDSAEVKLLMKTGEFWIKRWFAETYLVKLEGIQIVFSMPVFS